MDFFDEDDEPQQARARRPAQRSRAAAAGGGGARPPGAPTNKQQVRTRQAALAVGAIIVFILLVLAFRGCLNARKERSFQNYVSDLSSLTAETQQLSDNFFKRFGQNADLTDLSFESEVNSDRGTSQGLLDRAAGLSAPDQLQEAQSQIVLSYELRHDALEVIADQLGIALASADSKSSAKDVKGATDAIANQMKVLLASDVLFKRAHDQIEQSLSAEGIVVGDGVPESQFLPDTPDYLNPATVQAALAGVAGASGGTPNDGLVHGLGLVSVVVQPDGVTLDQTVPATVTTTKPEIEVSVMNQGEAPESEIEVTVSIDSTAGNGGGSQTISSIEAQETQAVTIPLRSVPPAGEAVTMTVDVATVGGEQIADNNTGTYTVTFG